MQKCFHCGASKKTNRIDTWARAKPFWFANWPWQIFLPWTWNWYKLRETCEWNTKFRSEIPTGKSRPPFQIFHFFLGIFQWDEPMKRVPFTANRKFRKFWLNGKRPISQLLRTQTPLCAQRKTGFAPRFLLPKVPCASSSVGFRARLCAKNGKTKRIRRRQICNSKFHMSELSVNSILRKPDRLLYPANFSPVLL